MQTDQRLSGSDVRGYQAKDATSKGQLRMGQLGLIFSVCIVLGVGIVINRVGLNVHTQVVHEPQLCSAN